jgi:hypothetical protein
VFSVRVVVMVLTGRVQQCGAYVVQSFYSYAIYHI